MKCALLDVNADKVVRERDHDELPPLLAPEKGLQWYELIDSPPDYDPDTQTRKPSGHILDNNARTLTRQYTVAALPADASQARIFKRYEQALTDFLDREAQTKRYDNRITCAVRAGYVGPFQAEGQAFAVWMDTCNALGYQVFEEVKTGVRPLPSVADFLALMPAMTWPAQT